MFLEKYKKNFYSQSGEDGIINEILKRLDLYSRKNKWCCEFGAWDGKQSSNTYHNVEKNKFKAIYIEGNKNRFSILKKLSLENSNIICVNKYVSHKKNSKNNLDSVLKRTKIKKNFEILSIDIDSHDLIVWKNLKRYQPEIVVIEINSGIKPNIYQIHNKIKQGNSFASTVSVAKKKGYILVAHTGNCIFIKKKYKNKIKIPQNLINNPENLFDWRWIGRKESYMKKVLKLLIPFSLLEYLRKIKFNVLRQLG